MRFSNIIGQQIVKEKLISLARSGRVSHTQLFLGPEGSGNLALAIAFSQYLNCQSPLEHDSCGTCSSCQKFEKYIHPDLHFTFPTISPVKQSRELLEDWRDALIKNPYLSDFDWLNLLDSESNKQGNITSEECRDILSRLSLTSYEGNYKTQIIWQPEYLKNEGNILLKLLEEPPQQTLIILVTSNSDKILPTVLSRTQTVKIPRINDQDLENALMELHGCSAQKARDTSRLADGNYNLAIALLNLDEDGYFNLFSTWMRACFGLKVDEIQKVVDTLAGSGREFVKNFLQYSLQMIRSSFIQRYGTPELLRVNDAEAAFLQKFAPFIHERNLENITKILDESIFHAERNANLKIMFLNLSLYIGRQLSSAKVAV